MRDEKAISASETVGEQERAVAKTSPDRISRVSAPFVNLPPLGATDRINTLESKLQSSVKLLREEAEYRKKLQSRNFSELNDRLDAMVKQADRSRCDMDRSVKSMIAKDSVQLNELKKMMTQMQSELLKVTQRFEQRIEEVTGDLRTMTGLLNERDERTSQQFEKVARRFAAFESALHHLESGGRAHTPSDNEGRRLERERVIFDTLETMASRIEELESAVGRMEGQPLSEITAQIAALRNGQVRLKEQLFDLEERRRSSAPPDPMDSSRRPTPLPLARVQLESLPASQSEPVERDTNKETLEKLRKSIEAFQREKDKASK